MNADSLISIRPKYAHAILDGFKTMELRRRIPAIELGAKLWIYSTLPEGAVIGSVYVDEIIRLSPRELWEAHHQEMGVDLRAFEQYFRDVDIAVGIKLTKPSRTKPIALSTLREIRSDFHPPQVMKKLKPIMQMRFNRVDALVS